MKSVTRGEEDVREVEGVVSPAPIQDEVHNGGQVLGGGGGAAQGGEQQFAHFNARQKPKLKI